MIRTMCLRVIVLAILCVAGTGCGTHDTSDPSYGAMFKQTTRDRVQGNEFWGTSRQKDCTSGGVYEVCTPPGQGGI